MALSRPSGKHTVGTNKLHDHKRDACSRETRRQAQRSIKTKWQKERAEILIEESPVLGQDEINVEEIERWLDNNKLIKSTDNDLGEIWECQDVVGKMIGRR